MYNKLFLNLNTNCYKNYSECKMFYYPNIRCKDVNYFILFKRVTMSLSNS